MEDQDKNLLESPSITSSRCAMGIFRVKVKCERTSERKNIVFETVPSYIFV